jgi:hypothetical protein
LEHYIPLLGKGAEILLYLPDLPFIFFREFPLLVFKDFLLEGFGEGLAQMRHQALHVLL